MSIPAFRFNKLQYYYPTNNPYDINSPTVCLTNTMWPVLEKNIQNINFHSEHATNTAIVR
jgi:hypothetical protein